MTKHLTRNDVKEIVTEITSEFENHIRDDISKFKDDILHEIVNLRDDFAVLTGYRDIIEDHDQRIVKIEQKIFPAKN